MHIIDIRSDTVTRPTDAMRQAMASAEVGDDVFGEDPTVNRLEKMAAEMTGKESALFVTSGTMGNLVSQLAHCGRGDEMILGDQSHIFYYEQGGSAAVGGIHPRIVPNKADGTIDLEDIRAAIRTDDIHFPGSRLIVLENTHNRCFGSPIDRQYIQSVAKIAHDSNLKLHIDGARIFNAAAALQTKAGDLVGDADSISFCLSKGLAAPAGSMVCGSEGFIARARRARKLLGGGMRQTGILAAAGIVSLTEMVDRLSEDHANARTFALGLADMDGILIDVDRVRTNLVFFSVTKNGLTASELAGKLDAEGVRVLPIPMDEDRIRAVIHYEISAGDIQHALGTIRSVLNRV